MDNIRVNTGKLQLFRDYFRKRFFLRLHMFLILTATALTGLLASKALLMIHLRSMLIRYPAAVLISYLAFLFFIKLWLCYISEQRNKGNRGSKANSLLDTVGDAIDVVPGGGG